MIKEKKVQILIEVYKREKKQLEKDALKAQIFRVQNGKKVPNLTAYIKMKCGL